MTTPAITRIPAAEVFTTADVVNMLAGATDYWSAHQVECADCRFLPARVCAEHDEDNRMAFLAGKLSAGLANAGEEVLSALFGLGRRPAAVRVAAEYVPGEAAMAGQGAGR